MYNFETPEKAQKKQILEESNYSLVWILLLEK